MAITYKTLGQVIPAATTQTTLYTVPASTSAVASTLSICNVSAVSTTFLVAIQVAGASLTAKQYIIYDTIIAANDTVFLTLGFSLATTDVISVYAGTATIAFNLFGSEIA